MEALEEFPNLFIQSETSASTHEYSESNRASKYVMLGLLVFSHAMSYVSFTRAAILGGEGEGVGGGETKRRLLPRANFTYIPITNFHILSISSRYFYCPHYLHGEILSLL